LTETPLDLIGAILIAMPGMADIRFAHSVVYLCDHSDKGAMGLIVNKPAVDMKFDDLLEQLDIAPSVAVDDIRVYFGGPVETGRGFVLHTTDYASELRTLKIDEGVALTPTLDVLEDIAAGRGPSRVMMMLGYAGWGPGQLEGEIAQNGWLTCEGGSDLIFDAPDTEKWSRALERMGVDPALLSGAAGSA
jgi:putative transcriptional regulator